MRRDDLVVPLSLAHFLVHSVGDPEDLSSPSVLVELPMTGRFVFVDLVGRFQTGW